MERARVQDLRLRPNLVLVLPYELEGSHTITDDSGSQRVFYLDHGWDKTFGHAFGTVGAVGANVRDSIGIAPGDFIHFTRHAYEEWEDEDGVKWLFVNKDDIQGRLVPGENGVDANGIAEAEDRVERHLA